MTQLKVGDTVRRVNYSFSTAFEVGDIGVITAIEPGRGARVDKTGDVYQGLQFLEFVERGFDIKTNRWYVKVNSLEELEHVQAWFVGAGLTWRSGKTEHLGTVKTFPNIIGYYPGLPGVVQCFYSTKDSREIVFTYKTNLRVVDIKYPSLSAKDKAIREVRKEMEALAVKLKELENQS